MNPREGTSWTSFEGDRLIASGDPIEVAVQTRPVLDRRGHGPVLIFDDETGAQVEVDFRGSASDVRRRLVAARETTAAQSQLEPAADTDSPKGPGRPRLGVIAREVTLLPRHWEWLGAQPGGASVALRKLVEEARRRNESKDRARRAQEAAYRVLSALAGNAPGFEEAMRAFFANDPGRFDSHTADWPTDVRDYARRLASAAFAAASEADTAAVNSGAAADTARG